MKNSGLCAMGFALILAACSAEADEVDHSAMGHETGKMDHSEHMMNGPLSDKAVKDKKEAADLLVARFGVEACDDADLVGSLRRTSPEEGETIMRAYKTPVACAEGTSSAIKQLGFTEGEPGVFSGTSTDGAAEEIKIKMIGEGEDAAATVEWQATTK